MDNSHHTPDSSTAPNTKAREDAANSSASSSKWSDMALDFSENQSLHNPVEYKQTPEGGRL